MNMKKGLLCVIGILLQTTLWSIGGYDIERLSVKDGLKGNGIKKLLQDEQGYIWIATDREIYRYDGYCLRKCQSDREISQEIVCLTEDKENGYLWILYKQGETDCLDLKKHCFVEFDQGEESNGYTKQHVGALYLWQYGNGKGCRRIRRVGDKIQIDTFSQKVNDIHSDQAGNDWILTDRGVYLNGFERQLPHSDNARHIAVYHNLCLTVTSDRIVIYNASRRIVRETFFPIQLIEKLGRCSDKCMWNEQLLLFTAERTYAYHIIDGTFASPDSWQAVNGRVFSEYEGNVIVENGKGEWLCYRNNGEVKCLNPDVVKREELYCPIHTKIDAGMEAIARYDMGLWIYDVAKNELKKIQERDSITAMLADRTGCLWIGRKGDGVLCLRLNQRQIKDSEYPPVTTVTDIIFGSQHFTPGKVPLNLEGTHKNLTIHFSNFQYADIRSVRYQYYLEGMENEWNEITSGHTAVYYNLSPGTYIFHVRSTGNNDRWGEVSTYTFIIGHLWWRQWPAYVLYTLIIGGGVFFLLYRKKKKNGSSETEKTLEILENQGLKEQTTTLDSNDEVKKLIPRDQRFYDRLQSILTLNIENPEFTVDEWAVQMHLSRTRLYTRVKEVAGVSPSEMLKRVRMEYAARLLLETDLTVEEIRVRCGIGNSSQFYSHFKKQFGVTPYQYRTQTLNS